MSNSDWYNTTNKILELKGQVQISSRTSFNAPLTNLTRVQGLARSFVDYADRYLSVNRNNRDNQQEFPLTTQVGNPLVPSSYIYQLPTNISAESIRYHSFFNVTPQNTSTSYASAQQIYNRPYREFRYLNPDFTQLTMGPPQIWILLPKNLSAAQGATNDCIMFYPIPDQIYNIIFQAKTDAAPLILDTDPILFPVKYEHILWNYAGLFLEMMMGEGKEQEAAALAEKCYSEYLFWTAGPDEQRKSIRTGMAIWGPLRGRRVSMYSTTPPSGA